MMDTKLHMKSAMAHSLNMDICCKDVFQFHKRTSGLFKVEFQGTGIIALNAKAYDCFGNGNSKTSFKGVMKHINDIPKQKLMSTLFSKCPFYGVYRGIMIKNNQLVSYSQIKSGLSYF